MMFLLYVSLTFLSLVMLAWASHARGRMLWLGVLAFGWTIGQFNILVEAVVFRVIPAGTALVQLGVGLIVFAMFAALAVTVLRKWRGPGLSPVRLPVSTIDVVAVIVAYELLYFGAGTLVWPYVAPYYLAKGLPPQILVAALQVPRALVFALPAWWWLGTRPRYAPVVLGIAFAMLGGIAPMFPDNPYMPVPIRVAHGIETGTSNFLFGCIVAWLYRRRAAASERRQ